MVPIGLAGIPMKTGSMGREPRIGPFHPVLFRWVSWDVQKQIEGGKEEGATERATNEGMASRFKRTFESRKVY